MAAYGTDPRHYLPPHTSQLATKLSADGVDDCLVASTLALVNGASLGEATRTPAGHEPSTAALVRTAVRMRNKLDDPAAATHEQQRGALPASAAGRIVALMWPAYPTLLTDDIDFKPSWRCFRTSTSPSWRATPPTSRDPHRGSGSVTSAMPSRSCEPRSGRTGWRSSSTTPIARVASSCVASGSPRSRCASSPSVTRTPR